MATAPNNHRRNDPPMSARQGALIIRHLERLGTTAKAANRTARTHRAAVIRRLDEIETLLRRLIANGAR